MEVSKVVITIKADTRSYQRALRQAGRKLWWIELKYKFISWLRKFWVVR